MNSIKLFKHVSLIILVLLLAVNAYFFYANGKKGDEYEAVAKANQELQDENRVLEDKEKNISNTAREQRFDDLQSQAKLFVNLVFVQKIEGYQQRKDQAAGVMSEALQERYFPADEFNQNNVESKLLSEEYYIQNMDANQKEIDVLIEVEHEIDYLETGKKDKSKMFLRVHFVYEEDAWIATDIEDLFADTEEVKEEDPEANDV
ncbi:hypothetical protein M662_18770 [Bacillus sp. SB49]|uniref:hypothetical protein n=1 Tax=Bacillus sp. SB49 TaxID=1071080 RepID=UPI0004280264|nr:hypothetical protein [Bacillus sp. SB49]QHT48443.1 hypothetical protein M662_18770 [Bacillus sp. SB49]